MNPDKKDENEIVDMIDDDPLAEITVMDGGDGISYDVLPDDLFSFAQEMPATPVAPLTQTVAPAAPAPQAQVAPPAQATIEISDEPEEFADTKVHKKTDDLLKLSIFIICKNEAHIIKETLENLCKYINFSYYVISDTGSTDGTQEIIKSFFKSKNIKGNLYEDEWKDFGYNRSLALKYAFNKTDYILIFDADDKIYGNLIIPSPLTYDS